MPDTCSLPACVISLGSENTAPEVLWLLETRLSRGVRMPIEVGRTSRLSSFSAYSVNVIDPCTTKPELASFTGCFRCERCHTVDGSKSSKYAMRISLEALT